MRFVRSILLPVAAISITFLALWYTHRPAPVAQSSMEQVRQEAERGGYRLIDLESLWKLYQSNKDKILLVDTRQEWEYRSGHIKKAINFPMEPTWLSRWRKKRDLEAVLGPGRSRFIVFY